MVVLILGLVLTGTNCMVFAQQSGTDNDVSMFELKMKFEKDMETKVQDILDRIIGNKDARIANLSVDLKVEKQVTQDQSAGSKREETKAVDIEESDFMLPGVPSQSTPKPQKPVQETSSQRAQGSEKVTIPTMISKIKLAIIINKNIKDAENKKKDVDSIIQTALEINEERGDIYDSKLVPFATDSSFMEALMNPNMLVPALLGLLALLLLSAILPASVRQIANALKEGRGAEISINAKTEQAGEKGGGGGGGGGVGVGGEGGSEGALELKRKEELALEEAKKKPFYFLNKDNLKNLIYLLLEEPPEIIALVLTYLEPEFSGEIISNLPAELQMRVALAMATVRLTSEKDLKRLEDDIKKKIDFLIGGAESFVKIIEQVDLKTRAEMLAVLEEQSPRLAQRVREMIFTFEDIVKLPDQTVQYILRELSPSQLAIALRGQIPPTVVDKVMLNLSEGGRAMLKEEMEFGKPVTPQQIEEEIKRVEKITKRLEAENKIVLKQEETSRGVVIEGRLEKLTVGKREDEEESKPVDPQKANEHYRKGVQAYQMGNVELAITEFEQSLEYNPSLWQVCQVLGNCYYSRGKVQEAIKSYERALSLNPGNQQLRGWLDNQKSRLLQQPRV